MSDAFGPVFRSGEVLDQAAVWELQNADWLARILVKRDRLIAQMLDDGLVLLLPPDLVPEVTELYGMRVIRSAGITEPMLGLPGERPPV